jgi:hypothetical protein
VRPGGIISPLLFGVYINGLLNELNASGIGCTIGHKYCGALGYAGDVKLLVPTLSGLIKIVKICEQYAEQHDVVFNGPKSKLLIYSGSVNDLQVTINVGNQPVPVCDAAKHVGHTVCVSNQFKLVNGGTDNFNSNVNMFMSQFGSLQSIVKNKLFSQYCCTFYGSQICPPWHDSVSNICIQWHNAMCSVWRFPCVTHCDIIPLVVDSIPLELSLVFRFLKSYRSLLASKYETNQLCG